MKLLYLLFLSCALFAAGCSHRPRAISAKDLSVGEYLALYEDASASSPQEAVVSVRKFGWTERAFVSFSRSQIKEIGGTLPARFRVVRSAKGDALFRPL